MNCWEPSDDDEPRRPHFGRDLFAFGGVMALLLVLYGVFT